MSSGQGKLSSSSKYNVYHIVSIFSNLPLQVECISSYDDQLLVGTNKGHLLIYKISFNLPTSPAEINLIHSNKYFSKRPILQLDVIPEHKILISLAADNGVSIHDMSQFNCPALSTMERTKGATLFVLDIFRQTSLTGDPSITVRMCVVVGKRLQLFYWKNREFNSLQDDLTVPDYPKAVSWSKETLCLGFKNEYCLLNTLSGEQEELFTTGKQGEPLITRVSNEMLALVRDKKSILISGDVNHKMQAIYWNDFPIALVYDEPYLIAVCGKGIEIRTITSKIQIDSFPLPGARLISRTKRGNVYIASGNSIWCLKSCPVETQIESFLRDNQFELALSLANLCEELPGQRKQVDQIQMRYALNLFCNKDFTAAMDIFSKLGADSSQVIGLFPDLLPPEYRSKIEYSVAIPELQGKDLEDGLCALIQFLIQSRRSLLGDSKSKQQKITTVPIVGDGTSPIRIKSQMLQVIDTTLLKCYLQTNESLVASLVRLKENFCHLEETERALKRHGKQKELIIMYQTRGLHRKALELLFREKNVPRIIHYLQHLGAEHLGLILEFSKQVLTEFPNEESLKIFTEDIQEVESLSRPRVYDFLLNNFPHLVILYLEHVINVWKEQNPIFHNALINQYRERLCTPSPPSTIPISQEEYAHGIITNPTIPPLNQSLVPSQADKAEIRKKLLDFLRNSQHYTAEHVLVHFPYTGMDEERTLLYERLGRHEQALQIYITKLNDKAKALEYCKKNYEKSDPLGKEVFTLLMKMLVTPPSDTESKSDTVEPDMDTAIKLLHDYAPCIEPFRALKCLPDDIEIDRIQNFLKTSVQNHFSERRKLLIQKGLTKSEFLRASTEKCLCESELFRISDNTVCDVCRKRFTNQSAFARYPNGAVVHFSCQEHE